MMRIARCPRARPRRSEGMHEEATRIPTPGDDVPLIAQGSGFGSAGPREGRSRDQRRLLPRTLAPPHGGRQVQEAGRASAIVGPKWFRGDPRGEVDIAPRMVEHVGAKSGQARCASVDDGPELANISPNCGRLRGKLPYLRPIQGIEAKVGTRLTKFCAASAKPGELALRSAEVARSRTSLCGIDRVWPDVGQDRSGFGRTGTISIESGSNLVK